MPQPLFSCRSLSWTYLHEIDREELSHDEYLHAILRSQLEDDPDDDEIDSEVFAITIEDLRNPGPTPVIIEPSFTNRADFSKLMRSHVMAGSLQLPLTPEEDQIDESVTLVAARLGVPIHSSRRIAEFPQYLASSVISAEPAGPADGVCLGCRKQILAVDMVSKLSNCTHWVHCDCVLEYLFTTSECAACHAEIPYPRDANLRAWRALSLLWVRYAQGIVDRFDKAVAAFERHLRALDAEIPGYMTSARKVRVDGYLVQGEVLKRRLVRLALKQSQYHRAMADTGAPVSKRNDYKRRINDRLQLLVDLEADVQLFGHDLKKEAPTLNIEDGVVVT